LYDIQLVKQDLLNHFNIRKGEKLENPEFGTNIYAYIFDPLDQDTKNLIIQEIEDVVNYDPRVQLDQVEVDEFEHGVQVRISLLYIGYGIGEKLDLLFDNQQGLLTGPSSFYPANTTN
jgi:phage baseplate assembly protein W